MTINASRHIRRQPPKLPGVNPGGDGQAGFAYSIVSEALSAASSSGSSIAGSATLQENRSTSRLVTADPTPTAFTSDATSSSRNSALIVTATATPASNTIDIGPTGTLSMAASTMAVAMAQMSTAYTVPDQNMNHYSFFSPTMMKGLVAAGGIGIAAILCSILYVVFRALKIDVFGSCHCIRRAKRLRRSRSRNDGSDPFVEIIKERKGRDGSPITRTMDAFYERSPPTSPAALQSSERLEFQHVPQQDVIQDPLSRTQSLGITIPPTDIKSYLKEPKSAFLLPETPLPTQLMAHLDPSIQPSSEAYNTQRISELSSLSSGFGDAKIEVPESGPTARETLEDRRTSLAARLSRGKDALSWTPQSSFASVNNRDTTYTSTSEETAPRFRTVNSWVTHQRQRFHNSTSSIGEDIRTAQPPSTKHQTTHRRQESEVTNPVFKAHPGEQVDLQRGSLVPSEILNKRFGF